MAVVLVGAGLTGADLSGAGWGGAAGHPEQPSASLRTAALASSAAAGTTWMLSTGALARLVQAGLPTSLLQTIFDRPSTILLGASTPDPLAPQATRALSFTSATALIGALDAGRVPAGVADLVLDLEAWPLTPAAEQRAPVPAAQQALQAAHRAGKHLIFTPGVDLVPVLASGDRSGAARQAAYDRLLAGPGAAASDIFEVQAQGTEGTRSAATFAPAAVAAAHRGHPGEPVLVGLSTNPTGRRVTPADLLALVAATRHSAAGYWLNIPQAGRACPSCGTPQPQVAVAFLETLAGARVGAASPGTAASPAVSSSTVVDGAGQLVAAGGRPADWVLASAQFAAVVGDPAVARLVGGGSVFEPVSARQEPSRLVPVVPTLVVHSEAVLAQTVASGAVPGDIGAVLYDNERTAQTPADEQANPLAYDTLVAATAAAHHWTSICDLVEPVRLAPPDRNATHEVPPCSIVGLNTVQQSERDPAAYAALVARAVALVHQVAPGRPVLAGLSANPAGGPVTAAELTDDILATHSEVAGYWLNVPAPGPGCPRCGPPDPSLMADALAALGG